MPRNTNPVSDCTAWCSTCRAVAVTGHSGPYSASELQQFAITPNKPGRDPDVVAAEQARDEARAVFDNFDLTWQAALAARTRADIRGEITTAERRRLNEAEAAARERRDRAWVPVVRANGQLDRATRAAQQKQQTNAAS